MSDEFNVLRRFLAKKSGLALDAQKTYLVESRLKPIMQKAGLPDLAAVVKAIQCGNDIGLMREVVEAMTTNETFFFRDRTPFEKFKQIMLPQLIEARRAERRLRIWCAAASTGQEPYSLAMILDEEISKLSGWVVEIVATDLSRSVLATAQEGLYSQFEVQRGLPIAHLLRYFKREGDKWRISEHLRSRIRFEEFNLLSDYRELGCFDVIFCRNVLIYFDLATKKDVLDRMAGAILPDGYFVMGSAETVVGLTDSFVPDPEHRSFNVVRQSLAAAPRPSLRIVAGGA
jgi:chemotaxis protein methyltransferase CheR